MTLTCPVDESQGPLTPDDAGTVSGSVDVCPRGCLIRGTCYPEGSPNPDNACETCDPLRGFDAWSANDGAACSDGLFCTTDDQCEDRTCTGVPRACSDGVACTVGDRCDEQTDSCVPGQVDCGPEEVCSAGSGGCVQAESCVGCVVDFTCYDPLQPNPLDPCEVCDPEVTAIAWSNAPADTPCDDQLGCTEDDTCVAGRCVGSEVQCSDGLFCNGIEVCSEPSGACVVGGEPCPGLVCEEGVAQASCRAVVTSDTCSPAAWDGFDWGDDVCWQ